MKATVGTWPGSRPYLAVVIALCALGALYQRVTALFVGVSRWLVMAPMWAAGLFVLFRVLGLLLPADL